MQAAAHIVIEGLVQGVGFRWFVARKAEALGLGGYVRNLYDGNVEVLAVGERSLVEELIGDVKIGPRAAHVTNLRLTWTDASELQTHSGKFEIR